MAKKCLLVLALAAVAAGAFAQNNTITVDLGPALAGAAVKQIGKRIGGGEGSSNSSGLGIAAQYERQLFSNLSVAGRAAYVGGGIGIAEEKDGVKAVLEMKLNSFSLEGHVRYYPFTGTFFLDGMLGYANMAASFSGSVIAKDGQGSTSSKDVSTTALRHYFKFGAKLGLRIDFGSPGGFTFEPSIGWYGVIGFGDTLWKKLAADVPGDIASDKYDDVFKLIEILGVGGPRVTLAVGWRF